MEPPLNEVDEIPRPCAADTTGGEAFEKLESNQQRRSRHYSIVIIYFAFLVLRMQESIYYISIWNYLLYVDPNTDTSFLGMVYLVSGFSSLVASLLLGKLTNIISSTKLPILSGVAVMTMGNFLMAFAHAFPGDRKWVVLVAKTMVNIGMGVQGNMTAYLAMGSKLKERNRIMSFRSAMISFAAVIGGCIQMGFSTVGYPGYVFGPLRFDMYTLPAYTCALTELILLVLIMAVFNESWVSVYENTMEQASIHTNLTDNEAAADTCSTKEVAAGTSVQDGVVASVVACGDFENKLVEGACLENNAVAVAFLEEDVAAGANLEESYHPFMESNSNLLERENSPNQIRLKPMDKIAAFVTIVDRFVYSSCSFGFRAIAPPLTMLMFGWSPKDVLFYNSLATILCYISRAISELSIPFILKFATERLLMQVSCFLFIAFYLISFAWPSLPSLIPPGNNSQFQNNLISASPPNFKQTCKGIYGLENDFIHCANSMPANVYYINDGMLTSSLYDNCTQNWCNETTKVNIYQFCIGYFVLQAAAMPSGILASSTLLTKLPGPRKQGTIQGVNCAAGLLSASIAPQLATVVFQYAGPRPVWYMGLGILSFAIVPTIIFYRRLVPWKNYEGEETIVEGGENHQ